MVIFANADFSFRYKQPHSLSSIVKRSEKMIPILAMQRWLLYSTQWFQFGMQTIFCISWVLFTLFSDCGCFLSTLWESIRIYSCLFLHLKKFCELISFDIDGQSIHPFGHSSIHGRMDNGWMDGWMNGWIDEWANE